jgi:hypothetical protein
MRYELKDDSTDEARARWLARSKDPHFQRRRYEPMLKKVPGSKELVLGEWVDC